MDINMRLKRTLGLTLIFIAIAVLFLNFSLLIFPHYLTSINLVPGWLWNPLNLMIPYVFGDVYLISTTKIISGALAVVWTIILLTIGLALAE
jgi:hypothetical protein